MLHTIRLCAVLLVTVLAAGCAVPTSDYNELNKKYQDLLAEKGSWQGLLNAERRKVADLKGLNAELSALPPGDRMGSIEDPEFKVNPKSNGIILESDILFSSGSSKVKKEAERKIRKLAGILNSPEYKDYIVRVDGHTDDQPVVKTRTINIDNWFLSAKRAHSVMKMLMDSGVDESRLYLSGFGPNQTFVDNAPGRKGHPQNRRVEILLFEKK